MGVCNNCGNQISDGQLTCPVCGAYTGAGAQANNQTPQQNIICFLWVFIEKIISAKHVLCEAERFSKI